MEVAQHSCEECGRVIDRSKHRGRSCSTDCAKKVRTRGKRKWADATRLERFWSRVHKTSSCWNWTGPFNTRGYGVTNRSRKFILAHRLSWLIEHGTDPGDLCVLHHCDNPSCVRPDHLFLGDRQDNANDMLSKGREGHPIGETNPNVKLRDDQVDEIRRLKGRMRQVDIGSMFGIHQSHVSRIHRGVAWDS
jgi:hypothetical protein